MKTRLSFGLLGALGCVLAAIILELIFAPLGVASWFNDQGTRVLIFNNVVVQPSSPQHPKTGDIQLTLRWNHLNDLDLHCEDPFGERIYFGHRRANSKGELDVDMNAGRTKWSNRPIENIYWPFGSAPLGHYKVYVHHFRRNGGPNPVRFQCRVLVNGRVKTITGTSLYTEPPLRGPQEPLDLDAANRQPPTLIYEFNVRQKPKAVLGLASWLAALVVGSWAACLSGLLASCLILGLNRWYLRHQGRPLVRGQQEQQISLRSLLLGFLAGAICQLAFDLIAQTRAMPLDSGRIYGWMMLGCLMGIGLSRYTPHVPRLAALVAGAAGGILAGLAFLTASDGGAEIPGRLLGALLIGFAIGVTIYLVYESAEEPAEVITYDPLPELESLRAGYYEIGQRQTLRSSTLDFRERQRK
ncbi:MAG: hypothetical protein M3347_07120 [Armatimonadota bacterium]|nr:hypothetical protein [Armatimonadota bacterium]